MSDDRRGADSESIWAALVPELLVRNLDASRRFYCDLCGFSVKFERPEDKFAYIHIGLAQIMLEEIPADLENAWLTAELHYPLGRGINLQIEVPDIHHLYQRLLAAGFSPFKALQTSWYRDGDRKHGQLEFLVQDPDGYLLRFIQDIGWR